MQIPALVFVVGLTLLAGLTAPASAQTSRPEIEKTLMAAERAINEAVVKGDVAAFKRHVAAESWAIDPGGRMATSEFLKMFDQITKQLEIKRWDLSDFHVLWVTDDVAVQSYRWTGQGTYRGQPLPSEVWASTVWVNRDGNWMAVFHQETPAMELPGGPQ